MISRLAYGSMIIVLLAVFALLLGLKLLPYQQSHYRYEAVSVDDGSLALAWAADRDSRAIASLPVQMPESFRFEFPYANMQSQVEESAVKVLVKAPLPEAYGYVLKLTGQAETITLPLRRQSDGMWSTPAFVPLQADDTGRYFHGVRVFHVRGEACALAVERVVKL